jgi:hypothetical protein
MSHYGKYPGTASHPMPINPPYADKTVAGMLFAYINNIKKDLAVR